MKHRITNTLLILNLLVVTALLLRPYLITPSTSAQTKSTSVGDNQELARLMAEDSGPYS